MLHLSLTLPSFSMHFPGCRTAIVFLSIQASAFIIHSFAYVSLSEPQTGLNSVVQRISHAAIKNINEFTCV